MEEIVWEGRGKTWHGVRVIRRDGKLVVQTSYYGKPRTERSTMSSLYWMDSTDEIYTGQVLKVAATQKLTGGKE